MSSSRVRFAANNGDAYCPHCGVTKVYTLNEPSLLIRWKCSACRKKFSVTSGTIFHSRKLAIRDYLAIIALFANGVKGTAALQIVADDEHQSEVGLRAAAQAARGDGRGDRGDWRAGRRSPRLTAHISALRTRPENRKADRRQQRWVRNKRPAWLLLASVSAARGRGLWGREIRRGSDGAQRHTQRDRPCMRMKPGPGISCMRPS